jgi:hypothetical protein
VSPQRYLADTSAAADAVNDFSAVLDEIGPEARRAALLRAAVRLEEPFGRAGALTERLTAARLADARLEAQRARASEAMSAVVSAMTLVVGAARAGDPAEAEAASAEFNAAVGDLRSQPAPG